MLFFGNQQPREIFEMLQSYETAVQIKMKLFPKSHFQLYYEKEQQHNFLTHVLLQDFFCRVYMCSALSQLFDSGVPLLENDQVTNCMNEAINEPFANALFSQNNLIKHFLSQSLKVMKTNTKNRINDLYTISYFYSD